MSPDIFASRISKGDIKTLISGEQMSISVKNITAMTMNPDQPGFMVSNYLRPDTYLRVDDAHVEALLLHFLRDGGLRSGHKPS